MGSSEEKTDVSSDRVGRPSSVRPEQCFDGRGGIIRGPVRNSTQPVANTHGIANIGVVGTTRRRVARQPQNEEVVRLVYDRTAVGLAWGAAGKQKQETIQLTTRKTKAAQGCGKNRMRYACVPARLKVRCLSPPSTGIETDGARAGRRAGARERGNRRGKQGTRARVGAGVPQNLRCRRRPVFPRTPPLASASRASLPDVRGWVGRT